MAEAGLTVLLLEARTADARATLDGARRVDARPIRQRPGASRFTVAASRVMSATRLLFV